jgi:glycosyltransferase involved in cell wall biosynthesis
MKILLIANYVPDSQPSMQRYATLLQDGLRTAGQDVRVIRPLPKARRFGLGEYGAKWLGYVDKLVLFPGLLRSAVDWAEVVHICDHSNAFYMKYLEGRVHVVTCHDLFGVRSALGQIPENKTRWSGRRLQGMIFDGLRLAENIVCVSDATRTDLIRLGSGVWNANVSRIYNGLNFPYEPMERNEAASRLRRLGIPVDRPFILHVGGNDWYKNRLGVLRIVSLLRKRRGNQDVVLVMVGKPWTAELQQFVRMNELEGSVFELVNVAEKDLQALYSRAELLLFPSLDEGFGWPIIEAHACGCPVVTSNRAPMTEVGGDAATYIEPLDYESAAQTVAAVIGSRPAVREVTLRNAGRFSAAEMIRSYVALYRCLLSHNSASAGVVKREQAGGSTSASVN